MRIRNEGLSKLRPLIFNNLVVGETYKVENGSVYLCSALLTGNGYDSRTCIKKVVDLKSGHIYSASHCSHMEFIHIDAEVVL